MAMNRNQAKTLGLAAGGVAGVGILPLAIAGANTVPVILVAFAVGCGLMLEMKAIDEEPPE